MTFLVSLFCEPNWQKGAQNPTPALVRSAGSKFLSQLAGPWTSRGAEAVQLVTFPPVELPVQWISLPGGLEAKAWPSPQSAWLVLSASFACCPQNRRAFPALCCVCFALQSAGCPGQGVLCSSRWGWGNAHPRPMAWLVLGCPLACLTDFFLDDRLP